MPLMRRQDGGPQGLRRRLWVDQPVENRFHGSLNAKLPSTAEIDDAVAILNDLIDRADRGIPYSQASPFSRGHD